VKQSDFSSKAKDSAQVGQSAAKVVGGQAAVSAVSRSIVDRDIAFITKLLVAEQAAGLGDAASLGKQLGVHGGQDIFDIPGLGQADTARRIGGIPGQQQAGSGHTNGQDTGFDDPLAAHNTRPGSFVVGAPGMPSGRDLVAQGPGPADSDTHSGDGSDRSRPSVWVDRQTERSSSDGTQTWGSTLYRDYSGNFWRSDYHVERGGDGGVTSKETVFDNHGDPIKTTVITGEPDGTTTETTTNHQTGETTVVHPVDKPESGEGDPAPDENEPDEGASRSATPAPRGWYNPITGQSQNPGLATGNNKVNPGSEPAASPTPVEPLRLDPKILVINPSPDGPVADGNAPLRDVRRDVAGGTIIDPPRPN
jgi:hypothetical protein